MDKINVCGTKGQILAYETLKTMDKLSAICAAKEGG